MSDVSAGGEEDAETSGLAIASLFLGIIWLFGIGSIIAIILGYTGMKQIDASGGGMKVTQTNRWIAPTFFRQDSLLPSGNIAAYSDGRIGWIATPQGQGMLAGAQLKQVKGDLFRLYFRLMLSDRIEGRTVNAADSGMVTLREAGFPAPWIVE